MRRIAKFIGEMKEFTAWFPGMADAPGGLNEGLGALSAIFDEKKIEHEKMLDSPACKFFLLHKTLSLTATTYSSQRRVTRQENPQDRRLNGGGLT